MRPIIRWTLRQRRWSIFWWSVGVFAFIFITMVFYPSFRDSGAALEKSLENLPKAAVQLFGGSTNFFSPVGYLNSQIFFLLLPILLSILAIILGSSLIASEEKDGTLATLLARPVSRGRLLLGKIIAGSIILAIVSAVALITVVACAKIFDLDVASTSIAAAAFNCFLLAYATGAITFLLAATGRARNAAVGIGAFVGFGGYIISSLAGTVHWLRGPAKIFPFNYFQSEAILRGTYHWVSCLFFVAVILACGVLAYTAFRRRDLV